MTAGWFSKFPKDVVQCEQLIKGNVNILNEAPFADEPKTSKVDYSLIFGDPEQIQQKKEERSSPRKPPGRPRKSVGGAEAVAVLSSSPQPAITHPRFLGVSDHTVRILAQPSTPYHVNTNSRY